jgi:hypothetical protein
MKGQNLIATLICAGILGGSAIAQTQTFTGVVSDNMCGKQHMMKHTHPAQCARACVKSGSDYALVVGDKVYTLKGDKAQIDKFAGEKAKVIGTANEGTITVESIAASKK